MHIDWSDLQTLEALLREGTVEAASRALGLRHTSVSRRVTALEGRLGAQLFVRGARLEPTDLARAIAERARAMRASAAAIESMVSAERRTRAKRLVVTTNDALAPLLFRALSLEQHTFAIEVLVSDEELALARGQIDLALRPSPDPSGALKGRRLGRLRLGVYRAPRGLDLWILPSASLRARASMRWWQQVRESEPSRLRCDSLRAMRDACVAGLGRAVLPCVLAHEEPRLRLERELDGGPVLWLLSASSTRASRELRQAVDAIATALRAVEGAFAR